MITFHIVSLFPESMRTYLDSSMMQRAQEKGLFRYVLHNLTDWTVRNTRRVDDRPYGGGAGTIITIEPLTKALRDIQKEFGEMTILLMSPRWVLLSQELCYEFVWWGAGTPMESNEEIRRFSETFGQQYCVICGHYEGVDERIFDLFPIREISIWEYVLSSGELAALVLIDSVVRLIPGVLTEESLREESFSKELSGKKEYPQYSRPEVFEDLRVPATLLSGDQKKIEKWKKENCR